MPVAFEVDRFERVDASAGTVLLRVAGTVRTAGPVPAGAPSLVVDDGRARRRVPALPDPRGGAVADGGVVRAAFPVPSALLDAGRPAFALELGGGDVVDLPRPRRVVPGARPPAVDRARIAALEAERDVLAAQREELADELARAQALGEDVAALREQADAVTAQVAGRQAEQEAALAEAAARAEAAEARAAAAEQDVAELRAALAGAQVALGEGEGALEAALARVAELEARPEPEIFPTDPAGVDQRLLEFSAEVAALRERLADTEAVALEAMQDRAALEDDLRRTRDELVRRSWSAGRMAAVAAAATVVAVLVLVLALAGVL